MMPSLRAAAGVKELGIGGLGMQGYGCAGGSVALLGFVLMEIARIDPSFATFFGVHDGLAMGSIYIDGSEEQKQKWLPPMARLEKIGCFGLTEPLVGSGASGGLTTTAKRDGDSWILQWREALDRQCAMVRRLRSSGRAISTNNQVLHQLETSRRPAQRRSD